MRRRIVLYIFLGIFGTLCLVAAAYFMLMKKPICGKAGCGLAPKYMNGKECLSVQETIYDPSLPEPTQEPLLSDFYLAQGSGPPFCSPTWYSYRYVRNSDGKYGKLSPWSGTSKSKNKIPMPIFSGAAILPCFPKSECEQLGNTNTFNVPILALDPKEIDISDFNKPDGYTLNIHRQVGDGFKDGNPTGFDPTLEGDIVGSFDISVDSISFSDAVFNPNVTNTSSC